MARSRKSKRSLLGFLAAAILALSVQGGLAAPAQADNCWQADPIRMYCNYANEWLTGVRWFSAPGGNNLRMWFRNDVSDGHGGNVNKCVGYKAEGSGVMTYLGCGWGTFGGDIYVQRSWIFVANAVGGARVLYGGGKHWIPNV